MKLFHYPARSTKTATLPPQPSLLLLARPLPPPLCSSSHPLPNWYATSGSNVCPDRSAQCTMAWTSSTRSPWTLIS
eukprot:755878-Hanusia_phi.AAC.3